MIKHVEYIPKIVYDVRYTITSGNDDIPIPENFQDLIKGYIGTLTKSELSFKYLCQKNKVKKGKAKSWQEAFNIFKNKTPNEWYRFEDHLWDNYDGHEVY